MLAARAARAALSWRSGPSYRQVAAATRARTALVLHTTSTSTSTWCLLDRGKGARTAAIAVTPGTAGGGGWPLWAGARSGGININGSVQVRLFSADGGAKGGRAPAPPAAAAAAGADDAAASRGGGGGDSDAGDGAGHAVRDAARRKPAVEWSRDETQEWFKTHKEGIWAEYAHKFAKLDGEAMSGLSKEDFRAELGGLVGGAIYNDWRAALGEPPVQPGHPAAREATVQEVTLVLQSLQMSQLRDAPWSLAVGSPAKTSGDAGDLPRVSPIGLDDALDQLYSYLCYRFSAPAAAGSGVAVKEQLSSVLVSLAAAPGSGKSFLLDVLLQLRAEDIGRARKAVDVRKVRQGEFDSQQHARDDALDHIQRACPLPISYNGETPYESTTYDAIPAHGLALRLLHGAFSEKAKLDDLAKAFSARQLFLTPATAIGAIREAAGDAGRGIIVAIDEVTMVPEDDKGLNPVVVAATRLLLEHRVGLVVAALSATPVRMTATASQRQVHFVRVPRPTNAQLMAGLWSYEPFNTLTGGAKTNVEVLLVWLHGHWRTIAALRDIVQSDPAAASDFNGLCYQLREHDAVSPTLLHVQTAWPVVRDALLGKARGADYYGDLGSMEQLSVRGVLRNDVKSLAAAEPVVPEVSPFVLSVFVRRVEHGQLDGARQFAVARLRAMLELGPTPEDFERFHANFVAMRMRLTPDDERECDLRQWLGAPDDGAVAEMPVYSKPHSSGSLSVRIPDVVKFRGESSLDGVLEGLEGLAVSGASAGALSLAAGDVVHFGGTQPAIDSVSFAHARPSGKLVTLLWQMTRRTKDGSEPLRLGKKLGKGQAGLVDSLRNAPSVVRDGSVVYILVAWHSVYEPRGRGAQVPPEGVEHVIVLTETELERWYGPSLSQMAVFKLGLSVV